MRHPNPEMHKLIKTRWSIALILTGIMVVIYFGFILLVAFDKPFLAKPIGHNLTLGLPIGIGILVIAWILTGIYVSWANNVYDKKVNELKNKLQ